MFFFNLFRIHHFCNEIFLAIVLKYQNMQYYFFIKIKIFFKEFTWLITLDLVKFEPMIDKIDVYMYNCV